MSDMTLSKARLSSTREHRGGIVNPGGDWSTWHLNCDSPRPLGMAKQALGHFTFCRAAS